MTNKKIYIKVKDHSVSGEEFQLLYNEELDLLETYPQPAPEKLSEYYKSDDYISHTGSKRNLFEKAYHVVRRIALKRKLKIIDTYAVDDKNLLDIGCGTGDFLEVASQNGWRISGIEPNEHARAIANKKTRKAVFEIEQLLKFEAYSFDVITLWHVLEHLPKLEEHIAIFKKLLKPDGALIIAVPNFKSYDAEHYKNFWAAYDAPRHLWHFSKSSMSNLFSQVDMNVVKILPMKFDSYYVSLLSEKYMSGKMKYLNALKTGWLSNFKAKRSGEHSSLIYIIQNS